MSESKERISLLDELTKSRGYEIALLTTFNFDVEYFERAILSRLMACGTRKVSLYLDAKELAKSLSAVHSTGIGRRYIVNPIEMRAAFHPKVALLIGKSGAKLIVASSNIKASGYEINNEVFNTVYIDKENADATGVIHDAFKFFQHKKHEVDVKIYVNDAEVEYITRDGSYVIQPEETIGAALQSVFDIRIECGDAVEHLSGWYVSRIEVLQNRANINERVVELHFDRNAEDDKYREDIIRIFRAFSSCLPGLGEYRKTVAALQQFQNEREGEGADDEEESYILDIDIPDVYRTQYKQYSEIDRLQRNILASFNTNVFLSMPLRFSREREDCDDGEERKRSSLRNGVKREPSSSDKRFARFIRSQVKKINTPEFVEQVDVSRFLSVVALFFDIFNKYKSENKYEGVFALDYIVAVRTIMLQNVISAYIRDEGIIPDETRESLELLIVDTLLDNHLLISGKMDLEVHAYYENLNRELLIMADRALSIRERCSELIEKMFAGKRANGLTKKKNEYSIYLSNLFGFKDDNMLVTLVKEIYGSDAKLQMEDHVATITAYTERIVDHWVPNVELLRELNRYSHNVYTILTTRIKVHNTATSMGNPNPTMEIAHSIDMIYRKRSTTSTRKNGDIRMEKTVGGAF